MYVWADFECASCLCQSFLSHMSQNSPKDFKTGNKKAFILTGVTELGKERLFVSLNTSTFLTGGWKSSSAFSLHTETQREKKNFSGIKKCHNYFSELETLTPPFNAGDSNNSQETQHHLLLLLLLPVFLLHKTSEAFSLHNTSLLLCIPADALL